MKLLLHLSAWILAALLALVVLARPIRLVQVLHGGQAFDAMADGLHTGSSWSESIAYASPQPLSRD